jgi:hypothetical protein
VPHCSVGVLAKAGLATIAVRVPSHPLVQQILTAFGKAGRPIGEPVEHGVADHGAAQAPRPSHQ